MTHNPAAVMGSSGWQLVVSDSRDGGPAEAVTCPRARAAKPLDRAGITPGARWKEGARKSFIWREIDRFFELPCTTLHDRFNLHQEGGSMSQLFQAFLKDDEGQGMVEYAILLALISVVAIATIEALGIKVDATFKAVEAKL